MYAPGSCTKPENLLRREQQMHKSNNFILVAALVGALISCPFSANAEMPATVDGTKPTVKIDGSSTVYPVTEAVAEEFQNLKAGKVHVTVGISGTGGGFKKFVRGETDISNASRPISAEEMKAAKESNIEFIELPIAFDALTVMVNPKNDWVDFLTVSELKMIWEPGAQGKITRWNQVRPNWPDQPIKLYGAGSDSGTFDYFTEAVVGKAKASRGDFTASEDDNVLVQGISHDKYALGYFGYAYYAENKSVLKAVAVVPDGATATAANAVLPSQDTVLSGQYRPLSRPIFIYASKKSLLRPEVQEFVQFYMKNGASLASEVKYVPLPASSYEKGLARLAKGSVGTVFGGHSDMTAKADDLFTRELKS
jgi:phosphate transport system substrate-binding protein